MIARLACGHRGHVDLPCSTCTAEGAPPDPWMIVAAELELHDLRDRAAARRAARQADEERTDRALLLDSTRLPRRRNER